MSLVVMVCGCHGCGRHCRTPNAGTSIIKVTVLVLCAVVSREKEMRLEDVDVVSITSFVIRSVKTVIRHSQHFSPTFPSVTTMGYCSCTVLPIRKLNISLLFFIHVYIFAPLKSSDMLALYK